MLTVAIATGGELGPLVESRRERETRRQKVERELQARSTTFDRVKLRQHLTRHTADWRAMLRRRTENARLILRKVVADRLVCTPDAKGGYLVRRKGDPGLLLQMASLMPASWNPIASWLQQIDQLRRRPERFLARV